MVENEASQDSSPDADASSAPDLPQPTNRELMAPVLICCILVAVVAAGSSGWPTVRHKVTDWWRSYQLKPEYMERMDLAPGDVVLKQTGATVKNGSLALYFVFESGAPPNKVDGIEEDRYRVDVDVSVIVDGDNVHFFDSSWLFIPQCLKLQCESPLFEDISGYIEKDATVQFVAVQNGTVILDQASKISQLTLSDLDLERNQHGALEGFWVGQLWSPAEEGRVHYEAGRYDLAIRGFDASIEKRPEHGETFHYRGRTYLKMNDVDRAISDLIEAVRLSDASFGPSAGLALALNKVDDFDNQRLKSSLTTETLHRLYKNLAHEYATCAFGSHRNGTKALEYAETVCEETHHANVEYLKSLAEAQAECGEFENAIITVDRAIQLTGEGSKGRWKKELQAMREQFVAGKPIRQPRKSNLGDISKGTALNGTVEFE